MKLLVRVLEALVEDVPSLRLVDLKGGDKHNAIPREAFATVLLPKGARSVAWAAGRHYFRRRHGYWLVKMAPWGVVCRPCAVNFDRRMSILCTSLVFVTAPSLH